MPDQGSRRRSARTEAKRQAIVECAMRHFAADGYAGARIDDMAAELGIAKGSVFQHFGSKAGLFLAAFERATTALPRWLDAPDGVKSEGFFAVIRYWYDHSQHLIEEDFVPYRVWMIGVSGTDLALKREINRYLVSEDPEGTVELVEWGQERGDIRADVELDAIVSMVDWVSNSLQDALVTEELDPGLFHRLREQPDRQRARLDQFVLLLESALAARPAQSA